MNRLVPIGSPFSPALVSAAGERASMDFSNSSATHVRGRVADEEHVAARAAASMADGDLAIVGAYRPGVATGLACGLAAAGYPGVVSPPYAAGVGTLAVYPAMVGTWRHLH